MIKVGLVVSFFILFFLTSAMRLYVQQSARYLKSTSPRYAKDKRLEMPPVTLNPAPDLGILISNEKDFPKSVSGPVKIFRLLFVAMIANVFALIFVIS